MYFTNPYLLLVISDFRNLFITANSKHMVVMKIAYFAVNSIVLL